MNVDSCRCVRRAVCSAEVCIGIGSSGLEVLIFRSRAEEGSVVFAVVMLEASNAMRRWWCLCVEVRCMPKRLQNHALPLGMVSSLQFASAVNRKRLLAVGC